MTQYPDFLYSYIAYWCISLFVSCFQPYGISENLLFTYLLLLFIVNIFSGLKSLMFWPVLQYYSTINEL